MLSQPDLSTILNLEKYPISDPSDARYSAMVERYRQQLDQQQYCVLPEFILEGARMAAVEQALSNLAMGYRNTSTRNCYLQRQRDPAHAPDHPKNQFFDASYTMLAADVLPHDFALKRLYAWPAMIRFVCEITGTPELFVSDDPYQPVNLLCSGAGDRSAWHFDSWNAFTMTLLLQASDEGGEFQLVPNSRSKNNPDYVKLGEVLRGDESRVVTVSREPGSLVVFRGSTSVHRVTDVLGDTMRLMGVFVYEDQPGVIGDPQVNATVYGPRVSAIAG